MDFVKMHGLGNDFVMVQVNTWDDADLLQPCAESICDRHFGIGADGLVAIGRDQTADIFMRIFNPDGSEPEMCGNAIRCVGKLAWERKLVNQTGLSVRTKAGLRFPVVKLSGDKVESVTVDMGEPILSRDLLPMTGEGSTVKVSMVIPGQEFRITAVSMGNPHCIVFVPDIKSALVDQWGPLMEVHQLFPAKTNVEFVQVVNKNEMIMRVWERGAGITLACGTGACATLVAGVLNHLTDRSATIHLLGGDLFIEWKADDNHVYMTGPATEVFSGQIAI